MRHRLSVFITIFTLSLSLSACRGIGKVNRYLEEQMTQQSNVHSDERYTAYEKYKNEGKLSEDGHYQPEDSSIDSNRSGILVSFANNNNLLVTYYSDKEHTRIIDTKDYYAEPGTDIYAEVAVSEDINSTEYEISGFRIVEYNDKNDRIERKDLDSQYLSTGIVLHVPENYRGKGLSVEPVGQYKKRLIKFEDYYADEDGSKHALDGEWFINDKSIENDSAEINPLSSYIVSYKYNSDDFFYLSSSPASFYTDFALGEVIFKQRDPTDDTVDYTVELHKYISASLLSAQDREVSIDGGEVQRIKANTRLEIPRLKYGDLVTISTNKEWADLEKGRDLILIDSERTSNYEFKYTLTVPQKGGEFIFDPTEYKYEHGTIAFTCFGSRVTNTQILAKGSKIYYEQETADSGYWLPDGEHCIVVGDKEDTIRQLKEIHFEPRVKATVRLPQPEFGGKIIYKVNGSRITSKSYLANSGTKIQMDIKAWEGWKNNYKNGEIYTVGSELIQTATIAGKDVNTVFSEDDGHKPKLSVILEKSVGENMQFSIEASGFKLDSANYAADRKVSDLIDNSQVIVSNQKIGTEKGIYISMSNRAIPTGQAVRFVIVKTDKQGNSRSETRYENDMSNRLEPINIYDPDEIATSTTWYKSISIRIGVVDVRKYSVSKSSIHTVLTVRNAESNKILKQDDLVEGSQKVVVTIAPTPGYYVTGKRVTNGIYQDRMKFDDYVKRKDELVENHPAKKYIRITLGTADKFADYTYKLDGNVVSGTINAEEGQRLTLKYEVYGTDYKIKKKLLDALNDKTIEKRLDITEDMDGKTIDRKDFNIELVNGG